MPDFTVDAHIRQAAFVHARLLDRLIQDTEAELSQPHHCFVHESLREWLMVLRAERQTYGEIAAIMLPEQIGNAA